jgi:hypothetical protein
MKRREFIVVSACGAGALLVPGIVAARSRLKAKFVEIKELSGTTCNVKLTSGTSDHGDGGAMVLHTGNSAYCRAKSHWDVYEGDRLILNATVEEITRGRPSMPYDGVASKEFGRVILRSIRDNGLKNTARFLGTKTVDQWQAIEKKYGNLRGSAWSSIGGRYSSTILHHQS